MENDFKKRNGGITLVALVITIILLVILAGISIATLTGSGLFKKAQLAKEQSEERQKEEQQTLGDYENKIGEYIEGNRQEITSTQPTGIKLDTYIYNTCEVTSSYTNYTSMSGLTISTDEGNKIGEYLSYSADEGYTILKSGWYMIRLSSRIYSKGDSSVSISCILNGINVAATTAFATNTWGNDNNNCSIYLKEGDIIYFTAGASGETAVTKSVFAYCYPMF